MYENSAEVGGFSEFQVNGLKKEILAKPKFKFFVENGQCARNFSKIQKKI